MIYLDSAAIVKLAHPEAESAPLERWLAARPSTARVTSTLAEIELPRALRRSAPAALARVPAILATLYRLEITASVRSASAAFGNSSLRTLDAIHLATALALQAELEAFVTYDTRLLAAAVAAGLPTAAPGTGQGGGARAAGPPPS